MADDPYHSLVDAFPVETTVEHKGDHVVFRVAGSLMVVRAEVERIKGLCAGRAWLRMLGPTRWGDEWVVHGTLRERGRLIPPDAQHTGKTHQRPTSGD